jgi:hypothetical protein
MPVVPPEGKPVNRHTGRQQPGINLGVRGTCHFDLESSLACAERDLRDVLGDAAVGRLEDLQDPEHDRIVGDVR